MMPVMLKKVWHKAACKALSRCLPSCDERRQGGGEDGAALQDHGVAREVGDLARQVGVDGLVDHLGQRPVQQRVEDLDDAVQRQEDDDEGTDQQDAARRAVAQV